MKNIMNMGCIKYEITSGRKLSPTPPSKKLSIESLNNKDEKSEEEDPAELRLLLELNEQVTMYYAIENTHGIVVKFKTQSHFFTGPMITSVRASQT